MGRTARKRLREGGDPSLLVSASSPFRVRGRNPGPQTPSLALSGSGSRAPFDRLVATVALLERGPSPFFGATGLGCLVTGRAGCGPPARPASVVAHCRLFTFSFCDCSRGPLASEALPGSTGPFFVSAICMVHIAWGGRLRTGDHSPNHSELMPFSAYFSEIVTLVS